MISEDALANLRNAIESITKYGDVDLVRRDEWSMITFDSVERHITYAITMTAFLAEMPLESLTDHAAGELQSRMPAVADQLARIDSFAIDQGDPSATSVLEAGLACAARLRRGMAPPCPNTGCGVPGAGVAAIRAFSTNSGRICHGICRDLRRRPYRLARRARGDRPCRFPPARTIAIVRACSA